MKKKVGIIFPSSTKGGVYQYALGIAEALVKFCKKYNYCIIYEGEKPLIDSQSPDTEITFVKIPNFNPSFIRKVIHFFSLYFGCASGIIRNMDAPLKEASVDILIIPTPLFFSIPFGIPYITSLPDHNDKYFPDFPEYSLKTKLARSVIFGHYGENATMVVADSKTTVTDLEKFSKVSKEKTVIIPYIPPPYILKNKNMTKEEALAITAKFDINFEYIFYPAQFWYQKNHLRLLEAIYILKKNYDLKVNLVLAGKDSGSKIYDSVKRMIVKKINELEISDQVKILGYVEQIETVALYKRSIALISPAIQVPTTIPPLEAIALGIPFLTVNLPEIPEQTKHSGIYFNPFSSEDIANSIRRIWTDFELRKEICEKIKRLSNEFSEEKYAKNWEMALECSFSLSNR